MKSDASPSYVLPSGAVIVSFQDAPDGANFGHLAVREHHEVIESPVRSAPGLIGAARSDVDLQVLLRRRRICGMKDGVLVEMTMTMMVMVVVVVSVG